MFHPKVSIVIPVYNGSNYLSQAIDSALAQTYDNCEIIIVNDGSRDDGLTEKIALWYGDKIRYISQTNGWVSVALNTWIRESSGEYISWLSHDDLYFPQKIQVQIEAISQLKNKKRLVYCDHQRMNFEGKIIQETVSANIADDKILFSFLIREHGINGCTTLIHRDIFDDIWLFDIGYRTIQDYDMWFRILVKYPPFYINQVLFISREHLEQWIRIIGLQDEKDLLSLWHREIWRHTLRNLQKNSIYTGLSFYKKYIFLYLQMKILRPALLYLAEHNYLFLLKILYWIIKRLWFEITYLKVKKI